MILTVRVAIDGRDDLRHLHEAVRVAVRERAVLEIVCGQPKPWLTTWLAPAVVPFVDTNGWDHANRMRSLALALVPDDLCVRTRHVRGCARRLIGAAGEHEIVVTAAAPRLLRALARII